MIVDSVMTRSVVTARPEQTVREAAVMMRDARIGCVLVLRGGTLDGILTERDIVARVVATGLDAAATRVDAVATRPVFVVEPSLDVEAALAEMARLKVKRLPVALDGTLRGIVTLTDLAHARPDLSKRFVESWVKPRWED